MEKFMVVKQIPRDRCVDHTLTLLQEGYLFIKNRMDQLQSDIFETRLLGKKVICMSGLEASKLFYNQKIFRRKGALPKRVQKTLFGVNGVQTMDGQRHTSRKKFFMEALNQEQQERLTKITAKKWEMAASRWEQTREVVLFDEMNDILCQAVCEWAGVPLTLDEGMYRSEDFSTMVNTFGEIGLKYWEGKKARSRTEKWIRGMIEDTRNAKIRPEKNTALYKASFYKEWDAKPMDTKMAAIELINIMRPIIAISRFITFAALGLHEHKECREKLFSGDENFMEMFVQEVRRYYPFAPFLGARVKRSFIWKGYRFKKGNLVLLDLYGTNHDRHLWEKPNEFRPERFQEKKDNSFDFIPQGGGETSKGHRCPGEGITIELMKISLDFLIHKIEFDVPKQNLEYSLIKIPSLPEDGFIMSNIKIKTTMSNV